MLNRYCQMVLEEVLFLGLPLPFTFVFGLSLHLDYKLPEREKVFHFYWHFYGVCWKQRPRPIWEFTIFDYFWKTSVASQSWLRSEPQVFSLLAVLIGVSKRKTETEAIPWVACGLTSQQKCRYTSWSVSVRSPRCPFRCPKNTLQERCIQRNETRLKGRIQWPC